MAWFRREKQPLKRTDRQGVPGDVFEKCPGCSEILYRERLHQNLGVCPQCGVHMRIEAGRYVEILLDEGSFVEFDGDMTSADPLGFADLKAYPERLRVAESKSGRKNAVISGEGTIEGRTVQLAVMDFRFVGGSMGSVVGEKIARAGRRALERRTPLIVVSASGGARMQEGIFSLMQMAKSSAVLGRMHEAGLPFVSILTDPTTGGVTASFAMLGDVNLAEPGALIGFAGPRVIEETIKQELPEGFQRAEFLLEHGMVDRVVDRRTIKLEVARLLDHMMGVSTVARAGGSTQTEDPTEALESPQTVGAADSAEAPEAPEATGTGSTADAGSSGERKHSERQVRLQGSKDLSLPDPLDEASGSQGPTRSPESPESRGVSGANGAGTGPERTIPPLGQESPRR